MCSMTGNPVSKIRLVVHCSMPVPMLAALQIVCGGRKVIAKLDCKIIITWFSQEQDEGCKYCKGCGKVEVI